MKKTWQTLEIQALVSVSRISAYRHVNFHMEIDHNYACIFCKRMIGLNGDVVKLWSYIWQIYCGY